MANTSNTSLGLLNNTVHYSRLANASEGLDKTNSKQGNSLVPIIKATMVIAIIIGNSLILAAVKRVQTYHNNINFWIANLAASGIVFGCLMIIRFLTTSLDLNTLPLCIFLMSALTTTMFVSGTCMIVMSYFSFTAMQNSMTPLAPTRREKRKTMHCIMASWVVWSGLCFISYTRTSMEHSASVKKCLLAGGIFSKASVMAPGVTGLLVVLVIICLQIGTIMRYRKCLRRVSIVPNATGLRTLAPMTTSFQVSGHQMAPNRAGVRAIPFATQPSSPSTSKSEVVMSQRGNSEPRCIPHSAHTSLTLKAFDLNRPPLERNTRRGVLRSKVDQRQFHIVKGIMSVVIVYTTCLSPLCFTTIIYALCSYETCFVGATTVELSSIPISLHFLLNVIVIGIRSSEFRRQFKNIITCR